MVELKAEDLNQMSEAPRDGSTILAYHKDGMWFHPVRWRDQTWVDGGTEHWSNQWIEDYRQYDCAFLGWVSYPLLVTG